MNQYRKQYLDYYGMKDPGPEFDIHHIDCNRENNNIDNLLLIPKRLHHQYHWSLNYFNTVTDKTMASFDARITLEGDSFKRTMLRHLIDALDEIEEWRLIKVQADMALAEAHNGRS